MIMMLLVLCMALVLAYVAYRYTKKSKEGLSDERGCMWDPVHNEMRCNVR